MLDANGRELKPGDIVFLRAAVVEFRPAGKETDIVLGLRIDGREEMFMVLANNASVMLRANADDELAVDDLATLSAQSLKG